MLPSMRAYCSAAGQCSSGLGCSDELTPRCRPTCASDADCISSEACYETRFGERVCVPARCRDSTECLGPGEWCGSIGIGDDRHCRTDCMDSAQCPKDFVCSSITSQVGPPFTCRPTCASDAQCPDGSFCLSEQDHPAFCAVGCNESADCPEAEHCVRWPQLPWGLCLPGCTYDTECQGGRPCFTCVDGACKAPAQVIADVDADASAGSECAPSP